MQQAPHRPPIRRMAVVGAGAMGRGIAQIAAQAGVEVKLFDSRAEAMQAARQALDGIWRKLVQKERLTAQAAADALGRVVPCGRLEDLAGSELVVEAVVEDLGVKRELLARLEGIVGESCILATNTSSLSITAIAAACQRPGRVAGYHFFNPVPLMKVVEVIDGLRTEPGVAETLAELAQRMGHVPVRARDMPGFIVNHAGRAMNTEGLKIAQEAVAGFATVDVIMREQAGFRMGPFELLDLTALDVSHPVMESIYRQFYDEPRFRPSPITAIRLAGGMYGRKTGQGFYRYGEAGPDLAVELPAPSYAPGLHVWIDPTHHTGHAAVRALLSELDVRVVEAGEPGDDCLIVVTPYGEDASTAVSRLGVDPGRAVALDTFTGLERGRRRTLMSTPATLPQWRDAAHGLFGADGAPVSLIEDSPGFVAQRMLAHIVNVACDIAQQRIASPEDIDRAVSLGLGYPMGPLALGDALGAGTVLEVLRGMLRVTADPRYRPSLWLQRRAQLGLSLRHG